MRNIEEINNELESLKNEMAENKGTCTEVYTRIVGYYRSVRNWNKGKREEYNIRTPFLTPQKSNDTETIIITEEAPVETCEIIENEILDTEGVPQGELFEQSEKYLYFYRQTCPNCPPVKNFLDEIDMKGTSIDVDTTEGLDAAGRWGIYAAPTAIFLDTEGEELFRSNKVDELTVFLSKSEDKVLQNA